MGIMHRWARKASERGALPASAVFSVALHAVLIGAAVVATATPDDGRTEVPEVNIIARFLAPPDRQGGQTAQHEMLKFVALADPGTVLSGDKLRPADETRPEKEKSGLEIADVAPKPDIKGADSVYTEIEVDSAASRYAWSAAPAYPPAMLTAKREGYVKAEWVVDEAGYVDTTSFKLVDYTSEEFAKAVRDALPFMRFSPAKFGTKRVRQLVQQEFTFRINKVLADPNATKKPPEFIESSEL